MQLDLSYPAFFAVFFIIIFIGLVYSLGKILYAGWQSKSHLYDDYPAWCILPSFLLFSASLASFIMALVIVSNVIRKLGLFN